MQTQNRYTTQNRSHQDPRESWEELKEAVKGNWGNIFTDLAPELSEAVANAPEHVACPVHGGNDGYRLFSHFNETGRGICNTCGPQKSGFDTLSWVKGYGFKDAVREVGAWVRKEKLLPSSHRRSTPPARVARSKVNGEEALKRLRGVWLSSKPLKDSAAQTYLSKRGIWRDNQPSTLRSHSGLTYFNGKDKTAVAKFPCLLAPIRNKNDKIVSIHRIFLTPQGDKAPVDAPKKMMSAFGELRGAAIKLFPAGEVLGLTEGIETALAVHAVARIPVWSCVSAVLMECVEVPDSVKHVVIWADLDVSNRGVEAANKLADRLEKQGKTVEICVPQGPIPEGEKGIDWLDVMLRKGLRGFPAQWRQWRPDMASPD